MTLFANEEFSASYTYDRTLVFKSFILSPLGVVESAAASPQRLRGTFCISYTPESCWKCPLIPRAEGYKKILFAKFSEDKHDKNYETPAKSLLMSSTSHCALISPLQPIIREISGRSISN